MERKCKREEEEEEEEEEYESFYTKIHQRKYENLKKIKINENNNNYEKIS